MSSDNSGKASSICLKICFVETYPEVLSELTRRLKKQVVLTEMFIRIICKIGCQKMVVRVKRTLPSNIFFS